MEEYGDIYYVDDARNASRDHRAQGGTVYPGSRTGMRPSRTLVVQPPAPAGGYRPVYPPQTAMIYPQQPIMIGEPSPTAGSLLSRLTLTQIVEIAAQAFAALMSLPPAPLPQEETSTNVANLIVYQRALAEHAKKDEQIRTLGSLVAKLAG